MKDYSKALDNEGWSEHYNMNSLNSVVATVTSGGGYLCGLKNFAELLQKEIHAWRLAVAQG